jgi:hypothetical protein
MLCLNCSYKYKSKIKVSTRPKDDVVTKPIALPIDIAIPKVDETGKEYFIKYGQKETIARIGLEQTIRPDKKVEYI